MNEPIAHFQRRARSLQSRYQGWPYGFFRLGYIKADLRYRFYVYENIISFYNTTIMRMFIPIIHPLESHPLSSRSIPPIESFEVLVRSFPHSHSASHLQPPNSTFAILSSLHYTTLHRKSFGSPGHKYFLNSTLRSVTSLYYFLFSFCCTSSRNAEGATFLASLNSQDHRVTDGAEFVECSGLEELWDLM